MRDLGAGLLSGGAQVVFQLQSKPKLGGGPKVLRQARGGIRRNPSVAAHDFIETRRGDAKMLRELVYALV